MSLLHWKSSNSVPVSHSGNRLSPLFSLRNEINRLFDDMFSISHSPFAQPDKAVFTVPAVDISEDENGYKIQAELPGLDAKQVDVSIANGFLTIKGEKIEKNEEKSKNYIRRESSVGLFQRVIALPDSIDEEKTQATFKHGVLTIEIPRKANAETGTRKINVNDAA